MIKRLRTPVKKPIHFLDHPRDIVKHMSLRALSLDGQGGQRTVKHVCNQHCEGKHPE
jgi:hypothetical protein